MAYIVMAYIVMAYSYGLYSYRLCSHRLYSYRLYSYGRTSDPRMQRLLESELTPHGLHSRLTLRPLNFPSS